MPTATANGKRFTFPEGTTPEQMGQAIDEYFASQPGQVEQQPSTQPTEQPVQQDSFLDDSLDVLGEFAASANRTLTEFIDFIGPYRS